MRHDPKDAAVATRILFEFLEDLFGIEDVDPVALIALMCAQAAYTEFYSSLMAFLSIETARRSTESPDVM